MAPEFRRSGPREVRARRAVAIATLAAMFLTIAGCTSSSDGTPAATPSSVSSVVSSKPGSSSAGEGDVAVNPTAQSVLTVGSSSATVTIPSGGVAGDGSLTGRAQTALPVDVAFRPSPVWDLALNGTQLTGKAQVALPVAKQEQVIGMPPIPSDSGLIAYFNEQTQAWTPVATAVTGSVATASTDHLSRWSVVNWNFSWLKNWATSSLDAVMGISASDAQPKCAAADTLAGAGVQVASSDGELLRWCAEPVGEDSFTIRAVNPYAFSLEVTSPESYDVQRHDSGDSVLDTLARSGTELLTPPIRGSRVVIVGPGQSVDILIPKGTTGRIIALPSGAASLVDALAYAVKTAAMVWGKYPGTKVDPAKTQKIAETLLDNDECLTALRNLVLPGGTEVRDVRAVLGDVYSYSFTCLKSAWEKGYGISGVALTFVTGALSWLADGIKLFIGDVAGTAASLRFIGNWQIRFSPINTGTLSTGPVDGSDPTVLTWSGFGGAGLSESAGIYTATFAGTYWGGVVAALPPSTCDYQFTVNARLVQGSGYGVGAGASVSNAESHLR